MQLDKPSFKFITAPLEKSLGEKNFTQNPELTVNDLSTKLDLTQYRKLPYSYSHQLSADHHNLPAQFSPSA